MDGDLLRSLQKQSADALEQAIAQYGAYVLTIIRNRSRGVLTPEDHEEIASDVFLSLWHGAREHYIRAGKPLAGRGCPQ